MTGLMEFLRARLDEDASVATDATQDTTGRWTASETSWGGGLVVEDDCGALILPTTRNSAQYPHIARHNPVYVLADIESKREILKRHYVVGFEDEGGHDIGRGCAECGYSAEYSDRGGYCATVRLLAAPFSVEPGYNEGWAV